MEFSTSILRDGIVSAYLRKVKSWKSNSKSIENANTWGKYKHQCDDQIDCAEEGDEKEVEDNQYLTRLRQCPLVEYGILI